LLLVAAKLASLPLGLMSSTAAQQAMQAITPVIAAMTAKAATLKRGTDG